MPCLPLCSSLMSLPLPPSHQEISLFNLNIKIFIFSAPNATKGVLSCSSLDGKVSEGDKSDKKSKSQLRVTTSKPSHTLNMNVFFFHLQLLDVIRRYLAKSPPSNDRKKPKMWTDCLRQRTFLETTSRQSYFRSTRATLGPPFLISGIYDMPTTLTFFS